MPPKTHGHDTRFMKLQKNNCFVCGMNNPEGMRLKFILDEERQTFICRFRLGNAGEMRGNAGTGNAGTEMRGQTGRSPFFDRHRFARFPVNWGTSRLSPGFLPRFPPSVPRFPRKKRKHEPPSVEMLHAETVTCGPLA
ncbi:MAG: hypothetical protein ABSB39_24700 [Candidatus Sulfotelmatobacter sp.]|jgi:hypothetical protein